MKLYSVDDASLVLFQSAEIIGEAPTRPEAQACFQALHDFRTGRLSWEQMHALTEAADAAAAGRYCAAQGQEPLAPGVWAPAPPDATQSLIAVRLAQYELALQEAHAAGTPQIESRWHQEHIAALDTLNREHARGVAAQA